MTMPRCGWSVVAACVLTFAWSLTAAHAQTLPGAAPPAPAQPQVQASEDALGRDTPRGTVMGFLAAARRNDDEIAPQYLNTTLRGVEAATLAQQLFVVLDARLPPRLTQVSDAREGSRANPLRPDEEVVGALSSAGGDVVVVVERVPRATGDPIWLFSQATLAAVPALYDEVTLGLGARLLPRFLTSTRIGGIRLFEWIAALLGLPFFYLLTVVLNKILTPLVSALWRRLASQSDRLDAGVLPTPVRLLVLALAIRWLLSTLPFPLMVRQFWSNLASLLTIAGIVWLLIVVNAEAEQYIHRRFPRSNLAAGAALLRLLRRMADVLVIFAGLVVVLRYYGVDPTPALAGLGVGGIAVALAAQKTLENVVAGASLIFDQAVRVGDVLKMGEVIGTVDHIGLRSTRIRTLDRTIVSVPNSQIANMSLETISVRDKFWFHPLVGLRHETLPHQLHAVVDGIRRLLDEHPSVDRQSVRVRFLTMGPFSLDIDVFAYIAARDWNHFLEIQEQLLFGVTDVIEAAGTQIASRTPSMYTANPQDASALPRARPPLHPDDISDRRRSPVRGEPV
jgi:MscS family membrane protein